MLLLDRFSRDSVSSFSNIKIIEEWSQSIWNVLQHLKFVKTDRRKELLEHLLEVIINHDNRSKRFAALGYSTVWLLNEFDFTHKLSKSSLYLTEYNQFMRDNEKLKDYLQTLNLGLLTREQIIELLTFVDKSFSYFNVVE